MYCDSSILATIKMLFSSWTRKLLLLQLCLFTVGCLISSVRLSWTGYSIWTNGIQDINKSLSDSTNDDLLSTTKVWGLLICLSYMLHMEIPDQLRSKSVISAIYAYISIMSLILGGDSIVQSTRDTISLIDSTETFTHTAPADLKVILNLTATLSKHLSWLLFLMQTFVHSKELEVIQLQKVKSTHIIARMMTVPLIYLSFILWTVIVLQLDFKLTYAHYIIICYYLVIVLVAGCVRDDSAAKGTVLLIFSVTFMILILMDVGEKLILQCRTGWTQQCAQLNPMHVGVMVSSITAGALLYMYIFELCPSSDEPQMTENDPHLSLKSL